MFKNLDYEWATFIMRHRCTTNFFYHFLSVVLFWAGPILYFATSNLYYWILFFISGAVGGIGHVIGTDPGINFREATTSPAAVFMASYMVVRVLIGQYAKDIKWAEAFFENSEYSSPIKS